MKAVVEAAVAHMGGLDVLVISGGNGGWEYLVSTTCIRFIEGTPCVACSRDQSLCHHYVKIRISASQSHSPLCSRFLYRVWLGVQGLDPDDLASYRLLQELSVLSPMMLAEAAVPEMKKAGGGSVVSRWTTQRRSPVALTCPHGRMSRGARGLSA